MKHLLLTTLLVLGISAVISTSAMAQRDYFTPEEVELIRGAQEIDRRIEVLKRAMDRRFAVLKIDVAAPAFKEKSEWGPLPEGSRAELLRDIRKILQKAVDDTDSLAERPESAILPAEDQKKKAEGINVLFPRAVRSLAAAAQRYGPALKSELDRACEPAEKGSLIDTLELCDLIIASVAKLPAEVKKSGKKDH